MSFTNNSINFPNLTTKGTPVGADIALIADSEDSNKVKQIVLSTWPIPDGSITTAKIATGAVTSDTLDNTLIKYLKVAIPTATFKALWSAPFILIAAPGAGKIISVEKATLSMVFNTTQYTLGGSPFLQFDSTVHGGGTVAASGSVTAANINGWNVSSFANFNGTTAGVAQSTCVNKGLYATNGVQDFATGNSDFEMHIWYSIIDLN